MRWKGIIFLGILFAIILIVAWLFTDKLVENELESLATYANGAKVEIDDLEISFTDLYIRWSRLQITNPRQTMRNRLETGKCELDFEFWPLLSDKFIVESFAMTGIRTNTAREEDGGISKEEAAAQSGVLTNTTRYLEREVSDLVAPQLTGLKKKVNVDSLLSLLDVQSVIKINKLKQESDSIYNGWEQKLTTLEIEKDAKEVESQIKSIDVNQLKTADQILAASTKVDNIYTLIKTNATELNKIKSDLTDDFSSIQSQVGQIDDWIKDDYARAFSLAKIPRINAETIGKLIFGRQVVDQINGYLDYIALARKYSSGEARERPEKQSPPRLKGQDIYFYNENARPDFWIKEIDVSGLTENEISWAGQVSDIVSDQRQIGKPTNISISGGKAGGINISLNGLLNYLEEEPAESFKLVYSGFSLANTNLSGSSLLPNKIAGGVGAVRTEMDIKADEIKGILSFSGKKMNFEFGGAKESQSKIEQIVQSVLKSIDEVDFAARIQGKAGNLKFSIDSNLDELFANKVGAIVDEEFNKVRADIQKKIDGEVLKYRSELDQLISGKQNLLSGEISDYEDLLKMEMNRADGKKKEIEAIYTKEKKNLENKVKDLIKF